MLFTLHLHRHQAVLAYGDGHAGLHVLQELIAHPEDFNCLFCYCPLYTLGSRCGGNFKYLENGVKDCSNCLLPHGRGSYSYILSKFPELMELAKKNR